MPILEYLRDNWEFVAAAAYMGLEFFIGKTDKVKANSVLELAWNVATMWKTRQPKA